jgi:hypothetical protein
MRMEPERTDFDSFTDRGRNAPPLRSRFASLGDVVEILKPFELDMFLPAMKKLGVEMVSDLQFITSTDLKDMGMNVIQSRKFIEAIKKETVHR